MIECSYQCSGCLEQTMYKSIDWIQRASRPTLRALDEAVMSNLKDCKGTKGSMGWLPRKLFEPCCFYLAVRGEI